MSDKTNQLKFEDALPQLVTAYREGVLVPFLGSGMSMGVCASWRDMLIGLLKQLKLRVPKKLETGKTHDSKLLYRVADEVIGPLEAQPLKKRAKIYRAGLSYGRSTKDIPSQTKALAGAFWPLVITTNYDDVYWKATPKGRQNPAPTVLGRDRRDCHEVLSSLDSGLEPLLWCIQGFVGGQKLAKPKDIVRNRQKREQLLREVVLGYQQYQRATNDAPHFRRAFAEVCRRRSLLFLGSGITEDYLLNLFSEIRHHHGPSRRPHFALVKKDDCREDEYRFMELRLGIVPILYEDHTDLPKWLKMFTDEIRKPPFNPDEGETWKSPSQMIAANYRIGKGDGSHIDLEIKYRALQKSDNEAMVISVGKDGNTPLLGGMAQDVLRLNNLEDSWKPHPKKPKLVFQHNKAQWLFAVAARKKSSDYRDLGIIPEALASGLEAAAKCHSVIHVGAIASGPKRPWHPAHPFVQMLCGIRKFVASNNTGCAKRIVLHIVDWSVWLAIWAKKVVIPELLFSDLVTYSVDLESYTGDRERFSVTMPANKCLKDLLKRCGLKKKQWKAELKPSLGKDEVKDVKGNVIIPPSVIVVLRKKQTRG